MKRAGVSYFGVRIPRHARRDLEDIAARGYTAVLHTFSENDLAYYRGTMAEIVAASHKLGLEVQMCPWGVGRTFGGEAESRWVTFHPEACQVLDDGRRVATGCLNNPVYRAFCKEWADAAIEAGTDYVFWDEPHWTVPEHAGVDDPERWACVCQVCAELSGLDLSQGLTPEVQQFRESSVVNFLGEVTAHVAARGGKNTICLLPLTEGPHGVSDWDSVAALPHLSVLATDPYWKNFAESAESFVGRFARLLAETAGRHDVEAQMWLPSFGLTRDYIPDLEAAVQATHAAGVDDVWTWGYEACGHMTHLATPDSPLVWEAVTAALTGGGAATERQRVDLRDLDLRPTAELVRLINDEDRTIAGAVADAAESIAAAIDAIVEIVFRTSFCAVPAFMRVEPAITSGPTSISMASSTCRVSSESRTHASPIVRAPAFAASWTAESVYGVRPLALTARTMSFSSTPRASRSFAPAAVLSSAASSSVVTATTRSVEKVGPHSAASAAAARPDDPAPT